MIIFNCEITFKKTIEIQKMLNTLICENQI